MTPRERILKALNHEEPDRVPIDFGGPMSTVEAEAYEDLIDYLKLEEKTMVFSRAHVAPSEQVLTSFNADCRYIYFNEPSVWKTDPGSEIKYKGEWGITWHKPKSSHYLDPIGHPLKDASIKDLDNYPWPTSVGEKRKRWKNLAEHLDKDTNYAVGADVQGLGIFEQAFNLRGFAKFLKDLGKNERFAHKLLEKVLETQKSRLKPYMGEIGSHIDFIVFSDDLAMQDGQLMSLDMYREFIKPKHRELYDFVSSKTDAKIFHHTCGAAKPFFNDLIDIGVDIINPIQVSAKGMEDTAKLKEEFGDRLVFWGGGCDTQGILPNGDPRDVEKEVKKRIKDLAPEGGFVFCAVHNIQPDVPPENIHTLYKTAYEFGNSFYTNEE